MLDFRKPLIKQKNQKIANLITLTTACFATCLDILSLSATNVAIPSIATDMDLDSSTTPWLIASYAIAFAAFLMPAGKLGDLYGYRIVYLSGLLIFMVASIICGVAPNEYVLFVFRALQGFGAACTVPNAIALIANSYTDDRSRGIAISIFGGSGTVGFTLGLILGGVLSSAVGWRWIFYITAIASLIMLIPAFIFVPDFRHEGSAEKIDMLGFFLITSGFVLIIYALSDGQWHLARDPVTLVIGVLLIIGFLLWQFKSKYPLIRPSWWRRQNFTVAVAASFLQYAVFMGYIYVTTLMFQDAFGYSPIKTSLYYLPMGIVAFVVSNCAGYIVPYVGMRTTMIVSSLMTLAANIGALYYSESINFWALIFPMQVLMAASLPLLFVAGQTALLATATPSETGTLGAVYNTAGQLGSGVGSAIMTAVVNGVNKNQANDLKGLPGYHAAYYVNIGLMSILVILCVIFIKSNRKDVSSSSEGSIVTVQDLEKNPVEVDEIPNKKIDTPDHSAVEISE
ncbi:hypothetical protein INT44_002700 [Umbelopsis vinacea]|uniref:Major facilitator superfamily (MFS) profile domain-containing protein n=1 Tax=Umbelopsis vinacea TaxID=44442 RepID=A0A8H7Q751_9FUNG|nr:hypothetical protein INT44_002700 [Umbelopsis vinacea]